MIKQFVIALVTLIMTGTIHAGPVIPAGSPDDALLAKTILMDSVNMETSEGHGMVPQLAAYYAAVLLDAGFAEEDIVITPFGETATLAATLHGSGDGKPILLIGHMDVVAADPADWERDPFTAIEEDGYIFGRGVLDNKFGVAMQVTAMARLKRDGYVPRQDVILLLSGDEETSQKSAEVLAENYKHAELALNSDAGGGVLGDDGKPQYYTMQAAEKTYSDYEIEFTSAGGHSSRPSSVNAITQLSTALVKLGHYHFAPQSTELTEASLRGMAQQVDSEMSAAMLAFLDNPDDAGALAIIRNSPTYVGQIGTTCVSTMVKAGHAVNALPQRATANINCRIFPGVSAEAVMAELTRVVDDPAAKITMIWDPVVTDASPLREDVTSAVTDAVHTTHPGVPIIPSMSAGTTDSALFRAVGVPSYGTSGLFMRSIDGYAHGLNERVPVDAIPGALVHWDSLVRSLTN